VTPVQAHVLTRTETIAYGAVGLVAFLALWSFLSLSGVVPHQFLPAPH
jgi:ABC-type nitrate/sulfonate/bicarbonate transport system permease component